MFIAQLPRQKEKIKSNDLYLSAPRILSTFKTGDFLLICYKVTPNDKPLYFSGILVAQTRCAQHTRFIVKKTYSEIACTFSFIKEARIVVSIEKKFEIKSRQANLFYLFANK